MAKEIMDRLAGDHERIRRFLTALDRLAIAIERGAVEAGRVSHAIDFVDRFVEGFHHVREENVLFQRLMEIGCASEATGDHVVHCHNEGRDQLEGMRLSRAVDTQDRRTGWVWNARAYAELMREHLRMEDEQLFPNIRSRLSPYDRTWLSERMDAMFPEENSINAWADETIVQVDPSRTHEAKRQTTN